MYIVHTLRTYVRTYICMVPMYMQMINNVMLNSVERLEGSSRLSLSISIDEKRYLFKWLHFVRIVQEGNKKKANGK